jgi:hypothetical protein
VRGLPATEVLKHDWVVVRGDSVAVVTEKGEPETSLTSLLPMDMVGRGGTTAMNIPEKENRTDAGTRQRLTMLCQAVFELVESRERGALSGVFV